MTFCRAASATGESPLYPVLISVLAAVAIARRASSSGEAPLEATAALLAAIFSMS